MARCCAVESLFIPANYPISQRFEVLLDRLERSELGINLGWRLEQEFLHTQQQGMNRLSLAILSMGSLVSGAILQQLLGQDSVSSPLIEMVSQGLLLSGIGLMSWVTIAVLRSF